MGLEEAEAAMSWRPQPLRGVGDPLPPTPLEQTAADLIGWRAVSACTQSFNQQTHDFQVAWNGANPNNPLVVDGKYGPLTRGALQNVMSTIGQGTAPPDCFTPGGVGPAPVPPTPTPTPPVTPVVPPVAPTPTVTPPPKQPSSMLPSLLIGAGVATAGYFGYLYWKKNRRR